jgi:hypothetical protein
MGSPQNKRGGGRKKKKERNNKKESYPDENLLGQAVARDGSG